MKKEKLEVHVWVKCCTDKVVYRCYIMRGAKNAMAVIDIMNEDVYQFDAFSEYENEVSAIKNYLYALFGKNIKVVVY